MAGKALLMLLTFYCLLFFFVAVDIWLLYAQFAMERFSAMPDGMEFPRKVFEKAIVACGIHCSKVQHVCNSVNGKESFRSLFKWGTSLTLFVYLSVCLSLSCSISVSLFVCLSVSLSLSLSLSHQGNLVWNNYREFEMAILRSLQVEQLLIYWLCVCSQHLLHC